MRRMMKCVVPVLALCAAAPLDAQLANAAPAALGMGGSYTAAARGFSAVAWNPAALGLTGNPETSAMIGGFLVQGGIGPISPNDMSLFADDFVPLSVKEQWLSDITTRGGQVGTAGVDMTWATVQTGRFAAQVSTSARALNDISPGFAELLLFGNVDDQGVAKNLDLSGSAIDATLHTSFGLSFGMPILLQGGASRLAFGVTGKYTFGHLLAVSEPSAGQTTADPVSLQFNFPIAYTPLEKDNGGHRMKSGSGFGADVGLAYETRQLVLTAVAQNVVNTFAWDETLLFYRPAELIFSDTASGSDFDRQPLVNAPAALRDRVAAAKFHPTYAFGAMLRTSQAVSRAADARFGSTDGMTTRAPVHVGAGAELRPLRWLPLQVGAAYVRTDAEHAGMQFSGGLGLQLGGFNMSASAAHRNLGDQPENMLMVSLLSHSFFGVRRGPVQARTNSSQ